MWVQYLHWSVVGYGYIIYVGAWWDLATEFMLELSEM